MNHVFCGTVGQRESKIEIGVLPRGDLIHSLTSAIEDLPTARHFVITNNSRVNQLVLDGWDARGWEQFFPSEE